MKAWIIYSFVTTVLAVAAAGFAVGVVVSGGLDGDSGIVQTTLSPTESQQPEPQPTEYRPRLTATEAASKAKTHLVIGLPSAESPSADQLNFRLGFICETRDFNQNDLAWIVVCSRSGSAIQFTFAVDDRTGEVEGR